MYRSFCPPNSSLIISDNSISGRSPKIFFQIFLRFLAAGYPKISTSIAHCAAPPLSSHLSSLRCNSLPFQLKLFFRLDRAGVFPTVGFNHPGGMTSVMPLAVKLALKDKGVTFGIKARQEREAHRRGFPGFCSSKILS